MLKKLMLRTPRCAGVALAIAAVASMTVLAGCRGARLASTDGDAVAAFVTLPAPIARADEPAPPPPEEAPAPAPAPAPEEAPAPAPAPAPEEAPAPAPAPAPEEAPAPAPAAEEAPAPAPAAPPASADEEARRLAAELARQQEIERQKAQFVVDQLVASARAHVARQAYVEAEADLLKARELAPTNATVASELASVQQVLSRRGASAAGTVEELRRQQQVRIDEQRTTAEKHAASGRAALAKAHWDTAIESFEQALFIISSSPYPIDWRGLKQTAENGLAEARRGREQSTKAERRKATETAIGELAKEEEKRLIEEQQRLEVTLFSAIDAFQRGEYDLAEQLAQNVLDVEPDNVKARELIDCARAARHDQIGKERLAKEQRAFQDWMDDMDATRNLEHRILKWPSQRFWDDITRLRANRRVAFGGDKVNPDEAALAAKLRTTMVNLDVADRPFKEVVQTLQIQTGVNLYIDPRISDVAEQSVPQIRVEQIPLEEALNMLKGVGGDVLWSIRGNVVVFTKKEFVKYNLVLQQHPVADLTAGLTSFIPPRIDLVMSDQVNDEENPLFGKEDEETIKPYGTAADLVELIKTAVGEPGTWEIEGNSITASGESAIIVRHTPEVQAQVARFLDDLRAFAGIVVTVETRFLTVSDNFLQDIGVDWRGLGGQTPGSLVNLDDVTNGLEDSASAGLDNSGPGLPAGAALNPSAGAYFNDGLDGDFRGRTENIFDRPLGSILSSLGGASMTLSFLDDSQFAAVIKAVEKTARGRTLTAPTITVYNTQRANLTVVNQLSYIQDFDVEVAQTSSIADPIIGVIQDGLTLDVRPTVSNDRKYITLELQPTVAKLLEPIPTFATTLASSFAPVIIQLPELRMQRARTTVRVPDGGSVVIGGLKNITSMDRSAEVPCIANIPILSFLFSRKGSSDEMSNLIILVRATITDLQEEEQRFRGR